MEDESSEEDEEEEQDESSTAIPPITKIEVDNDHKTRWRATVPPEFDTRYLGSGFSNPPDGFTHSVSVFSNVLGK